MCVYVYAYVCTYAYIMYMCMPPFPFLFLFVGGRRVLNVENPGTCNKEGGISKEKLTR